MTKIFAQFAADESGAVTVDWVVLTAAIVSVGIAVMASISNGLEDLSGDIETELTDQGISTTF
jgi:Flp pilus assembly pilin Flp